jgi:hypothetical protein
VTPWIGLTLGNAADLGEFWSDRTTVGAADCTHEPTDEDPRRLSLALDCPQDTPILLKLSVCPERRGDLITPDDVHVSNGGHGPYRR